MSVAPAGREGTLLVIVGPTGTGKSALALEVAGRIDGEIVSCDALQVYRGFDAGTAKPSAAERQRVPHHLVDVLDPSRDFTMGDFVRLADRAIAQVAGRGRVPLVVGGTGLYMRGLLRGIVGTPPRDPELKHRLQAMGRRRGGARMHRWLQRLDPESARRVRPGDAQRLVRAIELALTGDRSWSERLRGEGTWESGRERYRCMKIGLDMDRDGLGHRLDARVDRFFEAGLVGEIRDLLRREVPRDANAFKAIGYRQIVAALEAGIDPESTCAEIKRSTRRYAKRQRTWFRKEPDIAWLDAADEVAANAERVVRMWERLAPPNGH